jgi:hypothetical protein
VLQCSDGPSNKMSNSTRRHIDNMKLLLIYSFGSIFLSMYIWLYSCLRLCLCIFIVMSMYSYCKFMYLHRASWKSSATLTEVFPCFFLNCKANARVKLAKMGHGSHSSNIFLLFHALFIFVLFYVLFVLCRSVYCLCVNVYCTTATGCQSNCGLINTS